MRLCLRVYLHRVGVRKHLSGAVLIAGSKLTVILINGVALIAEKALMEVCRSLVIRAQKIPSEKNFINGLKFNRSCRKNRRF